MADSEDLGIGSDKLEALDESNGINDLDNALFNDTDGDAAGGDDPELEEIKARVCTPIICYCCKVSFSTTG